MYQFIGKIPCKSAYLCICGNTWLFLIFYMWHIHEDYSIITQKWGYLYLCNHVYIIYRIQRNEPIPAQKWGDSHLCMSRGLNLTYTISPILVWDQSWWGPVANWLQLICGPTWTSLVRSWSGCPKSGKQKDQLRSSCLQIGVKDWTGPDFKTLPRVERNECSVGEH